MIGNLLLACALSIGVGFHLSAPKTPLTEDLNIIKLPYYNKQVGSTYSVDATFSVKNTAGANTTWWSLNYLNGSNVDILTANNPYGTYEDIYARMMTDNIYDFSILVTNRSGLSSSGIAEFTCIYKQSYFTTDNLANNYFFFEVNYTGIDALTFGFNSFVAPHSASRSIDYEIDTSTRFYGIVNVYNQFANPDEDACLIFPFYFKGVNYASGDNNLSVRFINFVDIYGEFDTLFGGYQIGYDNGYIEGQKTGYHNGYIDGQNAGMQISQTSFMSLFASIVDTPMRMLYSLFNFDLFGTSMLIIILSTLTAIVVIKILKKFI